MAALIDVCLLKQPQAAGWMLFIRKRSSSKNRQTFSYQVIETYRAQGRMKQRVVANLGQCPTVEAALEVERANFAKIRQQIERSQTMPHTHSTGAQVSLEMGAIWPLLSTRCAPIVEARIALLESLLSRMSKQTGASDAT
jgi:hypothetical protein